MRFFTFITKGAITAFCIWCVAIIITGCVYEKTGPESINIENKDQKCLM